MVEDYTIVKVVSCIIKVVTRVIFMVLDCIGEHVNQVILVEVVHIVMVEDQHFAIFMEAIRFEDYKAMLEQKLMDSKVFILSLDFMVSIMNNLEVGNLNHLDIRTFLK